MRRASCDLLLTIAPPVASAVATPRGIVKLTVIYEK
jgi:hypothetical protein